MRTVCQLVVTVYSFSELLYSSIPFVKAISHPTSIQYQHCSVCVRSKNSLEERWKKDFGDHTFGVSYDSELTGISLLLFRVTVLAFHLVNISRGLYRGYQFRTGWFLECAIRRVWSLFGDMAHHNQWKLIYYLQAVS